MSILQNAQSIQLVRASSSQAQILANVSRNTITTIGNSNNICDLDIKVADSVVTEARSYKNIPLPRKQEFARAFMPGGEFHESSILDYAAAMRSC